MVCNYQRRQGFSSAAAAAAVAATTVSAGSAPVNYHGPIKPINTTGGQCSWCGKYGHHRGSCPFLR
ncbi:hypothetical protein VTP01DRAFT_3321 [Rhizomucor pusillus]|uniref:uncharacterized protein n=1 Tax=Rhizomucor pusillus TaxID=4840 RepID=UPI00374417D5